MHRSFLMWGVCALGLGLAGTAALTAEEQKTPQWQKIVVCDKFRSEGAAFGDFNKDGVMDVVSGHIWYEGPDFKKNISL